MMMTIVVMVSLAILILVTSLSSRLFAEMVILTVVGVIMYSVTKSGARNVPEEDAWVWEHCLLPRDD